MNAILEPAAFIPVEAIAMCVAFVLKRNGRNSVAGEGSGGEAHDVELGTGLWSKQYEQKESYRHFFVTCLPPALDRPWGDAQRQLPLKMLQSESLSMSAV